MHIICQGTTPTLSWDIPYDAAMIATANVIIQQLGRTMVEKTLKDCMCEENRLSLTLTQEETLKLDHRYAAKIQLAVRAIGTETVRTVVDDIQIAEALKKEPI